MMRDLPNRWQLYSIEDSMSAIIDYRGKTPTKAENGIPLVTAKIVKNGTIMPPTEYIAAEDYDAWMRRGMPKSGDVLITTEAPLGEIAQLDNGKVALAQRLIALRGKAGLLDNDFLKYAMMSSWVQNQLEARASGTTVRGIKQSELRKVMLALPPLAEQRAIAHILGSLDDKIELNRAMNQTLEEMARALFKSWFVDFDPVHAKARGEQPPGLDPAIAELFPSGFVETELGLVPEGWQVGTIGDVAEFAYGKSLTAKNRRAGNVPVYGSNGQVGWHDQHLVDGPGIVIGRKGNPGTIRWSYLDFFPIDTTFYVRLHDTSLSLHWLFFALEIQDLPNLSADSAVPGLNRNMAYMNKILIPDDSYLIRMFTGMVTPLWGMSQTNEMEFRTLAELRDTLLPKLMSGELRVPEAVEWVETN